MECLKLKLNSSQATKIDLELINKKLKVLKEQPVNYNTDLTNKGSLMMRLKLDCKELQTSIEKYQSMKTK